MWNLTELDTSTTTNQRSYFRSGVTPIASSTTRNTFSPVIRPRTSPHRHMPRATPPRHAPHHPPAPRTPPHPRITPPPHTLPHHHHPKVACNSQTGVTQIYEAIRTSKVLRGNCMRNCGTPRHPISRPTPPRLSPASRSRTTRPCHIPPTLQHQPSPKSHAIPEQE